MGRKIIFFFLWGLISTQGNEGGYGKHVFETYCWGCHHQSAEAFGPSFTEIASKRNTDEIRAMIADPEAVSKVLGYKRNAMPAFVLKEKELDAITKYILSFASSVEEKK